MLVFLVVDEDVRTDIADPAFLRKEVQSAAAVDLAISDLRHESEIGAEVVAEIAGVGEEVVLLFVAIRAERDRV